MKICKKCQIEKENSEFYNCPGCKDGLNSKCKACMKITSKLQNVNKTKTSKTKRVIQKRKYTKSTKVKTPQSNRKSKTSQYHTFKINEDGFGGRFKFDLSKLILDNSKNNVIIDRNKKHYTIIQVKNKDKNKLVEFCKLIDMNEKSIVFAERETANENMQCYYVNLFDVRFKDYEFLRGLYA